MKLKTKRTICSLVAIASILTIIGTVSYAYFTATTEVRAQKADLSTATVSAKFSDYGPEVGGSLNFGDSVTKRFTIENTGTIDADVKMYWDELTNTYTEGSLTYILTYSENEAGPYTEVVSKTDVPKSQVSSKKILADRLTIPVNKTYYYNLVITLNYLKDVNQNDDFNATFNSKFALEDINYIEPQPIVETVLNKANDASITNYEEGEKTEMYTFDHSGVQTQATGNSTAPKIYPTKLANDQEENIDYRYIGANPNNYIEFNDEVWRIIGVFTVEIETGKKEQLTKIVRDESIGRLPWDVKSDKSSDNEWSTSTLYTLLNGDYYSNGEPFTHIYYDNSGTEYTITLRGLNETARSQIANVKWYLGGTDTLTNLGGLDFYTFERGTKVYNGHSTSIMQRVGLIYPSDYIYTYSNNVDEKCFTDGVNCKVSKKANPSSGWLFKSKSMLTQSVYASLNLHQIYIGSSGGVDLNMTYYDNEVYPSVYLSSGIKISGEGTQENPYQIF